MATTTLSNLCHINLLVILLVRWWPAAIVIVVMPWHWLSASRCHRHCCHHHHRPSASPAVVVVTSTSVSCWCGLVHCRHRRDTVALAICVMSSSSLCLANHASRRRHDTVALASRVMLSLPASYWRGRVDALSSSSCVDLGVLLVQSCFKSDSLCLSWRRVNHTDRTQTISDHADESDERV